MSRAIAVVLILSVGCVTESVEPSSAAVEACAETETRPRVLTLLLTMSSIRSVAAPTDVAGAQSIQAELVRGAVRWVSPVPSPRILVVRDDNHNGEDADDPAGVGTGLDEADPTRQEQVRIQQILQQSSGPGSCVTLIDEPANGLALSDVRGYDVVWFSNPGHPLDDAQSVSTLLAFAELRGGVVVQGDDMARTETSALTHLNGTDNGTTFCGQAIDNNAAGSYRVTLSEQGASLLGLSFRDFLYGNDIDGSIPRNEGESVLATATLDQQQGCPTTPAIVAFGLAPAAAAP